jgi:hypothetical protein
VWLFLISDDSLKKRVYETILQKKRRMRTEDIVYEDGNILNRRKQKISHDNM